MERAKRILNLPLVYHLVAGLFIRVVLIVYGNIHDQIYEVPYTDVDYKVFTGAARYVIAGESPYKRDTYRYSPIIAFMLTPNILINKSFGKLVFSIFDILHAIAVKDLVAHHLRSVKDKTQASKIARWCSLFWLYNPMTIGISTRGNADSVSCFLIILSVLFLQTDAISGRWKYILSGVFLGISIHLRLYPLAFSFPMYLSLGDYKINRRTNISVGLRALLPNAEQLILTSSCILTLVSLTCGMFVLYGYEFLFETYIYHLFRKDTRHNFSLMFYYSYLTIDELSFDIVKMITQIFEFIILFVISLSFGPDPQTLPFALFCQSVILVAFNSVMTSQYFIWFLSLLPLVMHSFRLQRVKALLLPIIWITAQGAWLFYAYLLEFKSRETFILIWLKSVILFCVHIFVLGALIKSYSPNYGFGQIK